MAEVQAWAGSVGITTACEALAVSRSWFYRAQELIEQSCVKQGIQPGQLTIHADNGSAMISKSVAQLLMDLGIVKSHSRPHVSDDNPYSVAQFKTMKYRPDYPDRFSCLADARAWAQAFFTWYNHDHHPVRSGC